MLDTKMLGFKELFDVQLRATYQMNVAGRIIEVGEPIAVFESVQFGNFDELKERVDARGGYNNSARVSWETTKEVAFNFSQGIFSKMHLALIGNSETEKRETISAPMIENVTLDDNATVELKYPPIENRLFIYLIDTGEKIVNEYSLVDNKITFDSKYAYENIKFVYDFNYSSGAETIVVGRRLTEGYMELCGKTRLKDDNTGQTITGIIKIPKLKLMSDLSIRLGKDATPVVGNFRAIGYPVGAKGDTRVMDIILLNDDIDSDM